MSISYCCKKCDYRTEFLFNLKKHINKKKVCSKNVDAYHYSDDQILVLTLLPYYENKHCVEEYEIQNLKESKVLSQNKNELFNLLDEIDKTKCKKCKFCDNEYARIFDLKKHVLIECFLQNLNKNNENISNNTIQTTNVNINNNSNNTTNNTNNNNNTVNNVNIEIKTPIPFDNEWDISKIDKTIKQNLLMSNIMYTTLLTEILKNEINLNVIIDTETKSGIVYKNDIDKYIKMKLNDIIDDTMSKLRKHLIDINKESINTHVMPEIIDFSRKIINKKLIDYEKNNNGISKDVVNYISTIYDSRKDEAIRMSNSIIVNESGITNKIKGGF